MLCVRDFNIHLYTYLTLSMSGGQIDPPPLMYFYVSHDIWQIWGNYPEILSNENDPRLKFVSF